MKKLIVAAGVTAAVLSFSSPALAQTADQEASLLLGYSYLNVDQSFGDSGGAHGFIADYTYYMDRRWGFVVSASGHWGTIGAQANPLLVPEVDVRQFNFLAGPHTALWRTLTSELGIRGMAGAAWRKTDAANIGIDLTDEWAFAAGAEAHLDFRLSDRIWIRAIQPGAIWTNFNDDWQFNWRISAGFVIQAGQILQ